MSSEPHLWFRNITQDKISRAVIYLGNAAAAFEPLFYASGPFKSRYVLDKDTISNIVVVA